MQNIERATQETDCPCCKNILEIKQINFQEAILMCTNLKCPYPLDGDIKIYKRKLRDINSNTPSQYQNKGTRNHTKPKNKIDDLSLDIETLLGLSNGIKETWSDAHLHHKLDSKKIQPINSDISQRISQTVAGNSEHDLENDKDNDSNNVDVIKNTTYANCDESNSDCEVLQIEVEIDPVSKEVIVKTIHDESDTTDEEVSKNKSNIEETGKNNSALDYDVENLLEAKIDELLKDVDVGSVASIETFSENTDWLNDLLE